MNRKLEIESRLDRSLGNQLNVPTLDRRFDAAVWQRIEAQEQAAGDRMVRPATAGAERWLFASNAIGILVAVLLAGYFGVRMLSGIDISVELPRVSVEETTAIMRLAGWAITGAALLFGLMFTPLGRRLRSEFF